MPDERKPLEPTDDQVEAAMRALLYKPADDPRQMIRDCWTTIAPMILEEAAKACEVYPGDADDISGESPATVQKETGNECAARIRRMKPLQERRNELGDRLKQP